MPDNCATVWTTLSGAPTRFLYRGQPFTVTARPVFWVDRLPWWQQAARAPAGGGAHLLEQPMWQVRASTGGGASLTFDLAADPDSCQWQVMGVYG
ncbi:MAG: DUF6504 family protein [Propionibacteriaceae bacterium]|jgi:hypothetical protein|nr:DUF6504 family protein [Propionibacteriaceae bacterium]